jgi:hypothetical protein
MGISAQSAQRNLGTVLPLSVAPDRPNQFNFLWHTDQNGVKIMLEDRLKELCKQIAEHHEINAKFSPAGIVVEVRGTQTVQREYSLDMVSLARINVLTLELDAMRKEAGDRPANEIEITPEMIESGVIPLYRYHPDRGVSDEETVKAIFLAMIHSQSPSVTVGVDTL